MQMCDKSKKTFQTHIILTLTFHFDFISCCSVELLFWPISYLWLAQLFQSDNTDDMIAESIVKTVIISPVDVFSIQPLCSTAHTKTQLSGEPRDIHGVPNTYLSTCCCVRIIKIEFC